MTENRFKAAAAAGKAFVNEAPSQSAVKQATDAPKAKPAKKVAAPIDRATYGVRIKKSLIEKIKLLEKLDGSKTAGELIEDLLTGIVDNKLAAAEKEKPEIVGFFRDQISKE